MGFLVALDGNRAAHYFIREVQPKDNELSLDGKHQRGKSSVLYNSNNN